MTEQEQVDQIIKAIRESGLSHAQIMEIINRLLGE
jgi:tRNA A58 N-methylase Trm61